jgi:hypothetical protein
MSDKVTNKNVRDDEIDLLELFRRVGRILDRGLKALGRFFMKSLFFLLRIWVPLGLSVLVGIGASYFIKINSASSYTSDLVLKNNLALMNRLTLRDASGTTSEIISKINKLHTFCIEENSSALSAALSLKPESVMNISDISAFWIIDQSKDGIPDYVDYKGNYSAYDTVNIRMQDRLDVRVRIKSSQDLNLVREGIINFIQNDSLYQQRNRLRIRQNNDLLIRLNLDIKDLDSLQKIKYFEETQNRLPKVGGQMIFLQEQKTQLVYENIYSLYSRKQTLESERDLYKGVMTVLSDFSLPSRRDNGIMYYGKYVIPFFFSLTLLILILFANRNKIRELYNKY